MGKKVVLVSHEALESFFKGSDGYGSNLPDDARLLRFYHETKRNGEFVDTYVFLFESDEWEEVPEGAYIPQFDAAIQ